jgi:hypothetical protein
MTTRAWFLRWLLGCTVGELLGFACAALWAWAAYLLFGADPSSVGARAAVLALMVLAGVTEGAVLGALQWRVLREVFPTLSAARFVGATIGVAALGWFFGMLPSTLSAPAPQAAAGEPPLWVVLGAAAMLGALAGALFGWAQGRALRAHVSTVRPWVIGNALGWMLGLPFSFVAASVVDVGRSVSLAVLAGGAGGALMGASVALMTGRAALTMRAQTLAL